jgi:erythromycin esterase
MFHRMALSLMLGIALFLGCGPRDRSIRGQVRSADGAPLAGAVVAALPANPMAASDPWGPLRWTRSDAGGSFQLHLPAGAWAVSASHPRFLAAPPALVDTRTDGPPLPLTMASGGLLLQGTLEADLLCDRGLVAVTALSRANLRQTTRTWLAPVAGGRFELRLPPGTYLLKAVCRGYRQSGLWLDLREDGTRVQVPLEREPTRAPAAVLSWIRGQASPLAGPQAEAGADLEPLQAIVAGARVLGLGEATPGCREFLRFRQRILEQLVEHAGFTALAFEAGRVEARRVDAYVLTGQGDPETALAGLGRPAWEIEEILDLLRWMRRYNQDPSHVRKLRFHGYDLQGTQEAHAQLLSYLRRCDRAGAAILTGELAALAHADWQSADPAAGPAWQAAAERLLQRMDARRSLLVRLTGAEAFAQQRQNGVQLLQFGAMVGDGRGGLQGRQWAMASNVRWILERAGPGGKVLLWGHNAHISKAGASLCGLDPLGCLLQRSLGAQYLALGCAFRQGGIRATDPDPERGGAPLEFELQPHARGTLDAALAAAGQPQLLLDLRRIPRQGPVAQWFGQAQGTWSIAGPFSLANQDAGIQAIRVADHFDGLLFVERISRSRIL